VGNDSGQMTKDEGLQRTNCQCRMTKTEIADVAAAVRPATSGSSLGLRPSLVLRHWPMASPFISH
jgi:hypothetical protein